MERYTVAQRIEIVKIHYKNGGILAITTRKVRTAFGRHQAPSRVAITKLIDKFDRLGQVTDVKVPIRARRARSAENITAVTKHVIAKPGASILQRSKELGLSATTIHRILYKDLGLPPNVKKQRDDKSDESKSHQKNDNLMMGGAVLDSAEFVVK